MLFKRRLALMAASAAALAGGVASVGLTAGPAEAVGTIKSVTLPISQYSHMLVDPVHQHLFISSVTSTSILVTDYSGQTVATIPNEIGAEGLALSSDGSTVYAALSESDAIAAISTSTLTETARYSFGTEASPGSLAYTGGKIWFGYTNGEGQSGVGSVDPATSPATVALNVTNSAANTWNGTPSVVASPSGELVVADQSLNAHLATYDVSSGTPTALAPPTTFSKYGNVADMEITPNGKDVLVATTGAAAALDLQISDLSVVRQYAVNDDPRAVSMAGNGTVALGSEGAPESGEPEAALYAPGGSAPLNTYSFNNLGQSWIYAAQITPDGSELFAVTAPPQVSITPPDLVLNIISDPAQGASALSVAGPATDNKDGAITLTGTLGGTSPYVGGQTLHVSRIDPTDPNGIALQDVTTAADGSFTITDTPPKANVDSATVTYKVSYAGDAYLTAASASASVTVHYNNS